MGPGSTRGRDSLFIFLFGWHLSAYCEVQGIFGVGREPKLFDRRKQRCGLLLSVLLQLVTVSDVISFSDAQTRPTFQQRPGLTVDMYLDHLLPVVCRHKYFFKTAVYLHN